MQKKYIIRFLEELSLSALPALETVFLDGWVLRFSNDYTRRANSINPLYPGARPLDDNLRDGEALYRRRGQRVVFKLTPAGLPEGLDQVLAERGYAHEAATSVQTLDLAARAAPALGPTTLSEKLTDDWLSAVYVLNAIPERHQATLRQMLSRLAPQACFASLSVDDQVVSMGLGVLQAGWLGLYDIVTRPEQRGRGHARQLIGDLLAWAVSQGAHSAYLQVMKNNAQALRLYKRLGYTEQYQYWYRVKA
jgi:ribosomal protein S18 acetylase RimI-like enzyme